MKPRGWSDTANERRHEDLRWMDAGLENARGAAFRLGISIEALEKWCTRHDRELWRRLVARNPRDHNMHAAGKNQWTREAS